MRKPAFFICNCPADQRLCFRYIYTTIPLLSKSEILSPWPYSVAEQPGLRRTWSETPKTGFLTTMLKYYRCPIAAGTTTGPMYMGSDFKVRSTAAEYDETDATGVFPATPWCIYTDKIRAARY